MTRREQSSQKPLPAAATVVVDGARLPVEAGHVEAHRRHHCARQQWHCARCQQADGPPAAADHTVETSGKKKGREAATDRMIADLRS